MRSLLLRKLQYLGNYEIFNITNKQYKSGLPNVISKVIISFNYSNFDINNYAFLVHMKLLLARMLGSN